MMRIGLDLNILAESRPEMTEVSGSGISSLLTRSVPFRCAKPIGPSLALPLP